MKKIIFIIALLMIPSVNALTESSIYSGTAHDGQKIVEEDYEFLISVAPEGAALIKYPEGSTILTENTCKYQHNYHFCIGNITWSHRNVSIWKDIYQVPLDIYVLKGELEIVKIVLDDDLLIDDSTDVTLTFQNTGSATLTNLTLTDEYPEELEVTGVEGCGISKNILSYHGDLKSKVKRTCTFTLTAQGPIEFNSKAKATFNQGKTSKSIESDTQEIKVQNYSLQSSLLLNQTLFDIGSEVSFTLEIQNIHPELKIDVQSIKIIIPSGLKILKRDTDLDLVGNTLTWRGTLDPSQRMFFNTTIFTKFTGDYKIDHEARFKVGNHLRQTKNSIYFETKCDCPEVKIIKPENFEPGQKVNLKIYIQNPSSELKFRNIDIKSETDIKGASVIKKVYPILASQQTIMIFNDEITIPSSGSHYYDVSYSYKSSLGEYFSDKKSVIISSDSIEKVTINDTDAGNGSAILEETTPQDTSSQELPQKEKKKFSFSLGGKNPAIIIALVIVILIIIFGFFRSMRK